jgi:hypothetical protein
LAPVKLPKGLPLNPPPDKWWEQAKPCPEGGEYVSETSHGWVYHRCRDGEGRDHGPKISLDQEGRIWEDGWYRHGKRHGLIRKLHRGSEYSRLTYVNGVCNGPATESKSSGDYLNGKRHGRWTLVTRTGTRQHGYYVKGKKQGTWLAVIKHRGAQRVVGKAVYKNDKARGAITWWTEHGKRLATIKAGRTQTTWQFFSLKGKSTVSVGCAGENLSSIVITSKGRKLSCSYRQGRVKQQGDASRGLGCPGPETSLGEVCRTDVLDPWAATRFMSLSRIWD